MCHEMWQCIWIDVSSYSDDSEDIATYHPGTWVVSIERKSEPATTWKDGGVTTWRRGEVEPRNGRRWVEGAGTSSKDEEVVTVEMDRVRWRRDVRKLLDDPVVPLALVRDVDEVDVGWVAGVSGEQVRQSRVVPGNVNGRRVERPTDDVLAVANDGINRGDTNVEVVDLASKWSAGNSLRPVRHERTRLDAYIGLSERSACWCRLRDRAVGPDGATVKVVTAQAVSRGISAEPVAASGLVGINDHVVSLTDGEEKPLSCEGLDRNKIGGHDSERVVVERDTDEVVYSGVHKSQAVLLAGGDGDLVVGSATVGILVGAVDQNVVGVWWSASGLKVGSRLRKDLEGGLVVPLVDDVRAKVNIVVGRSRAVENHSSHYTITVLSGEVRVVPRGSELSDLEVVCPGITRSEGTFSNTVDTIVASAVVLPHTVPVDGSTVVLHGVLDIDRHHVTPVGLDGWGRVLAVDQKAQARTIAVWVASGVGDLQVVGDSVASRWEFLVEVGGNAVSVGPASTSKRTVGAGTVSYC